MAPSPEQTAALRERIRRELLDQLTDALLKCESVGHIDSPILRVEAFVEDGRHDKGSESSQSERLISVSCEDYGPVLYV